jgi:hypothetical protein
MSVMHVDAPTAAQARLLLLLLLLLPLTYVALRAHC